MRNEYADLVFVGNYHGFGLYRQDSMPKGVVKQLDRTLGDELEIDQLSTEEPLVTDAKVDGFESESPLRGFTDWRACGQYAIGKGFRPSVAHLTTYLDSIHSKEGWSLVQILGAEGEGKDMSMVFVRDPFAVYSSFAETPKAAENGSRTGRWVEPRKTGKVPELGMGYGKPAILNALVYRDDGNHPQMEVVPGKSAHELAPEGYKYAGSLPDDPATGIFVKQDIPIGIYGSEGNFYSCEPRGKRQGQDFYEKWRGRFLDFPTVCYTVAERDAPVTTSEDNPVEPKHYNGDHCARIGELLTPNCYQVLKYVWRLGKKDDAMIELGKAKWYNSREIDLFRKWGPPNGTPWPLEESFRFIQDICNDAGVEQYVMDIARLLQRHSYGDVTGQGDTPLKQVGKKLGELEQQQGKAA
ncbi:hypothetical protein [uncultured Sulfitobacter sp.]|uniref:hypothetical protein n=1 Tax=uncultured Sulfitobacter sp. TaxID=191468 RepID=UPI0025922FC6|nr:hypothetical protein [uncultured Sulfitobacter sp.]